ncbi:STN and carboxypeptidase regulatory-like domain-containing protein [Parabacteroides sp. PF5-9]|uniref:STN and carboxypeptidase regulatory-like domain-containing protein n=1 Tax=Parabacteroides sp. PF5-9 TaxID=1742404 RepID=UPI002475C5A2|nr:STN and carboxypeptidase regulatory-like domain-containing protein [Parabacteroides sp. PF5-9]MDH6358559.1 hypothetical protein [Parabacteroides sp. PF5-9]
MKNTFSRISLLILLWLSPLWVTTPLKAENEDILNRVIRMPKNSGTVYSLLGKVTDLSGFLFVYDSRLIDNDKKTRIKAGEYTIREAIQTITGNSRLQMRIIGSHILLTSPNEAIKTSQQNNLSPSISDSATYITIEGIIRDRYSEEVIPYASVGINNEAIGTITNQNGAFRLRIPDSLKTSPVHISHLGYIPQQIESSLLGGGHHLITLEPQVISLQEIIVRLINPQRLLEDVMNKLDRNYSSEPVYHTTFYREGIERKNKLQNLTEAVFKVYKSPYYNTSADQVKLLKMRHIINEQARDTLVAKFKSGINATLMLDLIKHQPDFLILDKYNPYNYLQADMSVIDNRQVYVLSFEQRQTITTPLYRGELFIDVENEALVGATFEINPKYVEKTADMLIIRKSKDLNIIPQKITYTVSYKHWNDTYYINHIRGDLEFRVRKKKQLFSSSNVHFWFEMATVKTETENVTRFTRNETLSTRTIFADTDSPYDAGFWENFNFIVPEKKLSEEINRISAKIEETGY